MRAGSQDWEDFRAGVIWEDIQAILGDTYEAHVELALTKGPPDDVPHKAKALIAKELLTVLALAGLQQEEDEDE